jgi:cell division protein FtsL
MKTRPPRGITGGTLAIALIAMTIVVMLAILKVYLSNRIYHESRTINHLASEVAALKEERSILQTHVERLKYRVEIADTLFELDDTASPPPPATPTQGGAE